MRFVLEDFDTAISHVMVVVVVQSSILVEGNSPMSTKKTLDQIVNDERRLMCLKQNIGGCLLTSYTIKNIEEYNEMILRRLQFRG